MSNNHASSHTFTAGEIQKAVGLLDIYKDKAVAPSVIIGRYTESSQRYDKAMEVINYTGQVQTAKALAELYPCKRDQVHVLDIAAGTGLCAVEIRKLGFMKIDAFDASEGMLKEAKSKGLYERCIHGFLGNDIITARSNTYDAIIMSALSIAILLKLPKKAFEELIRVVKPGGYIVNTNYYEAFADDNPEAVQFLENTRSLQASGKIKLISFQKFEEYLDGDDGAVRVHQVFK